MNKKKFILVILFSLITLTSCSKKDTFFSFCVSSDYEPKSFHSHDYASKGNIIFGQYYRVGGGYLHGTGCGMNKNYQGLPEGEIIAFWHSYKYDIDEEYQEKHNKLKNVRQETFYYAYEPDITKIKVPPKSQGHRNYVTFLSYGRFKLKPEALNGVNLTNVQYAETFSDIKLYQVGEIDKLYAKIYSDNPNYKTLTFDCIYITPQSEFYEIQAIEISEEQYDYFMRNIANVDNVYLNEQVPGFTEKQNKYMDVRKRIKKE